MLQLFKRKARQKEWTQRTAPAFLGWIKFLSAGISFFLWQYDLLAMKGSLLRFAKSAAVSN